MKTEIQGVTYDTDSASKIATFTKEFGADSIRHVEESLFQAENGRFFLAGGGGPLSRFGHPEGDHQVGGSGIVLLTARNARKWCETHHVDPDITHKFFPI